MVRRPDFLLCLVLCWTAPAMLVSAESQQESPETPSGEGSPTLDRLMQLPPTLDYGEGERGGMTRGEWRARYQNLRAALAAEREALEMVLAERSKIASTTDAWTLAPPIPGGGAAAGEAPLDYQIRQEIQRHRSEVEHLERALRELDVQADLAGVPAEWRQ